jgi:outer membrane immunogenic protein
MLRVPMKKTLFAATAIALALSAGAALAADLPSRKEAPVYIPPPPPPLWVGFYAGLNAGGTFGGDNTTNVLTSPLFAIPSTVNTFPGPASLAASAALTGSAPGGNNGGFIGGGQVGYNYQFYNNFLVGLEADIQGIAGTQGSGSHTAFVDALSGQGFPGNFAGGTVTVQKSLGYLGTVRGRLGYLVTPTLLIYGTGGLAYGGANSSTSIFGGNTGVNLGLCCGNPAFGSSGQLSDSLVGWTVGGGLEWMFMPNWSAKVEYLYYDLGNVTYSAGVSPVIAQPGGVQPVGQLLYQLASQTSTRFNGNIVRVGVNYHFNWGAPAPVVAKY